MADPDGDRSHTTPSLSAQRFGWCLYDFANSAYPTVVVTFLFGAWFQRALAPDPVTGGAHWAWAMAASGILVALVSPLAGHIADRRAGGTYRYLLWSTVVVIVGTLALGWAARDPVLGHGTAGTVLWVLIVVALTNTVFEVGFVFYNAFLPRLVGPDGTGRLSGKGWAFGYVGGLLALGICLALMPGDGAPAAETDRAIQASCLVVAGWFAVFAVPSLWLLRPAAGAGAALAAAAPETLADSVRGLVRTVRGLHQHRDLLALLIARLIYNDAVIAVITLAALYMGGTLGMGFQHILMVGIGLNVLAGLGAYAFGFVDDRVGGRVAVAISLVLLLLGTVLALLVPTVEAFYIAAALIGIALGPNQSASRSLLGRFVPPSRAAEFYGLFALSGKATVWLGPALFGVILGATGSQRWALAPLALMLLAGLLLLLRVDERRGVAHALAIDSVDEAGDGYLEPGGGPGGAR